jgi:uncharacterized protein (DUF2249 family)
MSSKTASNPDVQELDVRGMRKPEKHPTIFAAYAALPVGAAFVLVNDHDPQHLHEEFETDHAGSYSWEYLNRGDARLAHPDHQAGQHPTSARTGRHHHDHR